MSEQDERVEKAAEGWLRAKLPPTALRLLENSGYRELLIHAFSVGWTARDADVAGLVEALEKALTAARYPNDIRCVHLLFEADEALRKWRER